MPYVVPAAADLKARYPAFASVADNTITYWITDAQRIVTQSWAEGDYQPGILSLAAHNMALQKVPGLTTDAASNLPAGVTRFKSASVDIGISEAAANRTVSGGYAATPYGQEFAAMLRRNVGGAQLVGLVCL